MLFLRRGSDMVKYLFAMMSEDLCLTVHTDLDIFRYQWLVCCCFFRKKMLSKQWDTTFIYILSSFLVLITSYIDALLSDVMAIYNIDPRVVRQSSPSRSDCLALSVHVYLVDECIRLVVPQLVFKFYQRKEGGFCRIDFHIFDNLSYEAAI